MTDHALKRLSEGKDITFRSTDLNYGIKILKDNSLLVFTPEASMSLPPELITIIIEVRENGLI